MGFTASVFAQMTLDDLAIRTSPHGLIILGVVPADKQTGCMVLLGPAPNFWQVFSASSEALDGQVDPIDRWSTRVVGLLAKGVNARAVLPFGGPPFAPFLTYAQTSNRAWISHVGMLVHDTQGLLISYRGALEFECNLTHDTPILPRPCDRCAAKPCATACPVGALTPNGYDVDRCKAYLRTDAGAACLNKGCAVRRICPISDGAQRDVAQSALHMRAFLGA